MSTTSATPSSPTIPANAETYRPTPRPTRRRSRRPSRRSARRLDAIPEERRWLVTSEGAFCYLARDFGLKELYLWPINADQQGTPQQVRKVIDAVRENDIPVVFSESTVSADPAQQVARETGARLWRRALCRLAERAGRPGADLSRSAARDLRDHRQGPRASDAMPMACSRSSNARREPRRSAASPSRGVTVTYRNGHTALRDASFEIPDRHHRRAGRRQRLRQVDPVQGDHGLRAARQGRRSRSSGGRSRAALKSNLVAYVPQSEEVDWNFPVLVEDVVMMGRYGHMGLLRIPKAADRAAVDVGAGARRHGRLPQAPDRRTVRRPEQARLPGPRAGAGRPRDPARRAVHRRRPQHRGHHHRTCCATCATRGG